MKQSKLFSMLFSLLVIFLLAGVFCACVPETPTPPPSTKETEENFKYTNSINYGGYSVSIGSVTKTEIVIPSKNEKRLVSEIANSGFAKQKIKSVEIQKSIKRIGKSAFADCENLKSVKIENGVKEIGAYAFENCKNLEEISVPESVEKIEFGAFGGCTNLKKIKLPFAGKQNTNEASSESLFGYIFGTSNYDGGIATTQYYSANSSQVHYLPEKLTDVTIFGGSLLYGAFYNCNKITELTIASTVTSIDDKAFFGANSITKAKMPVCGFEVLTKSTQQKEKLTQIIIAGGGTVTPKLFYGCEQLEYIEIGTGIREIGDEAFFMCLGLKSFIASNELETIGQCVFVGCASLNQLSLGNGLQIIGDEAFSCCDFSVITIPPKVQRIGNFAFMQCTNLKKVTIGSGVKFIGYQAFEGCTELSNAIFTNTDEWRLSKPDSETAEIKMKSDFLKDQTVAATYLTSKYRDYYWERS